MDKPQHIICVLDDDPSVLKAMERLLRSADCAAVTFDNPRTFLQYAASHSVAAAVLDVCMPEMDGLEVQGHLREISPATRVIFLTSRDDVATREKALAAGAFAFLSKSADDEALLTTIRSAASPSSNGPR